MVKKVEKICNDYLGILLKDHEVPGIILLEEALSFSICMRLYYIQGNLSTDEYIKAINLWNNKYRKELIPLHYKCDSWNDLCYLILYYCKKIDKSLYSDNHPEPRLAEVKIQPLLDYGPEDTEAIIIN